MKPITFLINGEKIEFDPKKELRIVNVSKELSTAAAQMGWWGELWAQAEAEKIRADTFYRNWRAKLSESILEQDPKLAEWKVKAKIESADDFQRLKEALARAERNVIAARTIFQSFDKKANLLQTRGALKRTSIKAATGGTVKS